MVTPELIRSTAIQMANEIGLINLSRVDLCKKLKIKDGSFTVIAGMTFTELITSIRPECKKLNVDKPKKKTHTTKELRMELILDKALQISERDGFSRLSRAVVAEECGVHDSLIPYHFGTMVNFKRDIMRHAIRKENLNVIAQGLALRDPHAMKAPQELKDRAIGSLK